jgi:hypothetical protein
LRDLLLGEVRELKLLLVLIESHILISVHHLWIRLLHLHLIIILVLHLWVHLWVGVHELLGLLYVQRDVSRVLRNVASIVAVSSVIESFEL